MAYVDLNPIRAGVAKTPEESEFTSVYERIKAMRVDAALSQQACAAIPLRAFTDQLEESEKAIPYALRDYLALVDWSGRLIRKDKAPYILFVEHCPRTRRYRLKCREIGGCPKVLQLAVVLGVSADVLLFDQDERGPDQDFKLQFEALSALSPKEKQVAKAVLDAMIVKNQVAGALDRVKPPAAKARKRAKRRTDAKD